MSDALPVYWTPGFTDVFIDALSKDPAFQKASRSLEQTIVLRCLDTPRGTDVLVAYQIDRGRVSCAEFAEEPAPSSLRDRPFDKATTLGRSTAPFDFWVKLDKGEVGVIDVITSPDYQLEGSKLKILRYIKAFARMGDVAKELPKRYA